MSSFSFCLDLCHHLTDRDNWPPICFVYKADTRQELWMVKGNPWWNSSSSYNFVCIPAECHCIILDGSSLYAYILLMSWQKLVYIWHSESVCLHAAFFLLHGCCCISCYQRSWSFQYPLPSCQLFITHGQSRALSYLQRGCETKFEKSCINCEHNITNIFQ